MDKLIKLSQLIFPDLTDADTVESLEELMPERGLKEGAKVTRMAPSPTGSMHIGNLYGALSDERIAHTSTDDGVFILRIEDTDDKREVPGAVEAIIKYMGAFGIEFDEGATAEGDKGAYGPYRQRSRAKYYHIVARKLLLEGRAYPCFCSEDELKAAHEAQEAAKENFGYYGKWAKHRDMDIDEAIAKIEKGESFVLRFKSLGDPSKKVEFKDQIKGKISFPENDQDFVLLKSDGIPTYHFAHAVDDHLMGTTHVIRGEEWLPSLAKHVQLFSYLGFKLPKYMHIAQIMRIDENGNKKKLSKRDMGANMDDYTSMGYCPEAVCEYIMTLLNSNYEEWHMQNADKPYTSFPFNIKKMSVSGCLFDFAKLNDVSKNVISRMTADEVYNLSSEWAREFDPELYAELSANPEYTKSIFAIGRGGKKPRKDLSVWKDVRDYVDLFFDNLFEIKDSYPESFTKTDIKLTLQEFAKTFDANDDMNTWFEKIKDIADMLGFASDMKAYKQNPEAYKGNVSDISMFIRLAVTGKLNSPDMYSVMQILGYDRVINRVNEMIKVL